MAQATPAGPRAGVAQPRYVLPDVDLTLTLEPRLRDLVEIRIAQLNGSVRALVERVREALERGESRACARTNARDRAELAGDTEAVAPREVT